MFESLTRPDPVDLRVALTDTPVNLRDIERLMHGRIKADTVKKFVKTLEGRGFKEDGLGAKHKYIFDESGAHILAARIEEWLANKK